MPEEESIFRKIKTRLLPPSSRSFHSCMGELRDANRIMREQNETLLSMLERAEGRNAELLRRLDTQSTELADLRARLDRIDGGIGDISRKCDIKARHDEVRFEAAARMLAGGAMGYARRRSRRENAYSSIYRRRKATVASCSVRMRSSWEGSTRYDARTASITGSHTGRSSGHSPGAVPFHGTTISTSA